MTEKMLIEKFKPGTLWKRKNYALGGPEYYHMFITHQYKGNGFFSYYELENSIKRDISYNNANNYWIRVP